MEQVSVRLKAYIGKPWQYLYQFLRLINQGQDLPVHNVFEAGGRKCGKTESFNRFFWLAVLTNPHRTFSIFTIRVLQSARYEALDEALKVAPKAGEGKLWEVNRTRYLISNPTGADNFKWRFLGMLDSGKSKGIQKLGLGRLDADYTFILFEEASEFSPEQGQMVLDAVRLSNNAVIIGLGNPYYPQSVFFNQMNAILPADMAILKDEQRGRLFKLDKANKTIAQWTNIFAIQTEPYFRPRELKELRKGLKVAPYTGKTSLYGVPLALKGAIYPASAMRRLKYFVNPRSIIADLSSPTVDYLAGLDFGFTNDPAAFIGAFKCHRTGQYLLMNAFKQSQAQAGEFETSTFLNQVYSFIDKHIRGYCVANNKQLTVGTDAHALGLTSSLNEHLPAHLKPWVVFRSVATRFNVQLSIVRRIEKVLNGMSTGKLLLKADDEGLNALRKEGGSSKWKEQAEGATVLKRVAPDGDHLQDALEYAIC